MSTDTPVVLVALGGARDFWSEEPVRYLNERDTLPLVLLVDNPDVDIHDLSGLAHVEWHSIIRNSGRKHPAAFRQQAYEIIRDHTSMVPVGVIELDERFDKLWDIPIMKHWSTL